MTEPSQYPAEPPRPEAVRIPVKLPAGKPIATYMLIGITILIYGLQMLSQSLSANGYDWPFLLGGKINVFILKGEVWRLITPVFLHGSVLHIAFNMYALYSLGTSLERYYGHWKFLLLYFVSGFAGNTLSFLLTESASIGASTAVFGLVAAEGVFIYKNRELFGPRARSMLMNLGMIIVVNLLIGLQPNIDNWGHLGGLFGGAVFAWIGGPLLKLQTTIRGYELADVRTRHEVLWAFLLSAGLFVAVVIGRFLAAR